jgi:predicted nucleic acid-binding protein
VDTGGWYEVAVRSASYHRLSSEFYRFLVENRVRLLTSDYVFDETLTRLRYDEGYAVAMQFWRAMQSAQDENLLSVLRVDEDIWREAMEIFEKYSDQDFSFTDCTSFVLARRENLEDVFTFDRHFSIFGLNVWPAH